MDEEHIDRGAELIGVSLTRAIIISFLVRQDRTAKLLSDSKSQIDAVGY
jgi:hypothetical protein